MRIAVVGSYGTGLTMRTDQVPQRGETVGDGTFTMGPGGKGSNQAIGTARLGAQTALLTAIGTDTFGRQARELWQAEGVDASHVVTAEAATMAGVILVEGDAENRIIIAPGALDELCPVHVREFASGIDAADLVMTCNEIGADIVAETLRVGREQGVATLLNPAPARDIAPEVTGLIDYLTPNLGEARALTGLDTDAEPAALLDALRERFPTAAIVLTCGKDGAYVDEGQGRVHVPAVRPSRVVDTTGAGDAFNAALAVALCHGRDLSTATQYAVAAGAYAVSQHEVLPGLGGPTDLEALLPVGPWAD